MLQKANIAQGRALGGGSTVNGMFYSRGNRRDFDRWASLGNPGWDYNSVLPFFVKAEDFRGPLPPEFEKFHGRGGPLTVTPQPPTILARQFLKAGAQLGFPVVDFRGPIQAGFPENATFTIRDGVRCSTAECYLRPASYRPNLHILHSARVLKVLFRGTRVAGVTFEHNGKVMNVGARREVILSAGTLRSPQLLMVSGVGPREHLRRHNLDVVLDLPGVGQNLHDHIIVNGLSWTHPRNPAFSSPTEIFTPRSVHQYIRERQGPLAEVPVNLHNAFMRVGDRGDRDWPNLQILFLSSIFGDDFGTVNAASVNFDARRFKRYFGDIYGQSGFSMRPILVDPKSRGSLTLRSSDPRDDPYIDPNYLSHPDDVATLVEGIKLVLALGQTPALKDDVNAKFFDKPLPECAGEGPGSDSIGPVTFVTWLTPTSTSLGPVRWPPPQTHTVLSITGSGCVEWRPACGGCVSDANSNGGKHQHSQHHDWREGCGLHQAGVGQVGNISSPFPEIQT
ncbi:hypothetical protein Pcinc_030613 [Petrolisthes cinctipes]|uniref:Glucose-methanol-choline oxidoreductase N-terminal domain-containing protein n=1 Tax=Petrolisthes cinctipes TaxID=88211 RepID=A0AAE1K635_PETCI|nr:hypothetical protein Pcinc_030613 [Petrolisthes cinctipes]